MRAWSLFVVVVVAALVLIGFMADLVPEVVTTGLLGMVVVATGLAANLLASRRRRHRRADRPDSIEHECVAAAASSTLPVSLLVLVTVGTWLAITQNLAAAAVAYGGAGLVMATFWLSYAHARRHL